ncbi:MAG TPA: SRPBCC domain-containing protein [Candidatus Acidoferrales bacterium]|nr:SRPBCC domain-containing protein [Candidatus Acidoferrales bacterium]
MKKEVAMIKQTVIIPNASPKQIYEAYTDPKKHTEFTGSKASGKPVVGGKYSAWDGYIFGKYMALAEGKSVVQEWATTDWEDGYPASKLELNFKAVPEGTEITLNQTGVPKAQVSEFEQGWLDFYWNPLKTYFKKK